jgi:hypothetical protein
MSSKVHDLSPSFRASVLLLVQLHHEMATGDPDGEKADVIRDAMDLHWYQMSERERQLLRGLSADLYTIGETWESPREVSVL